MYFKKLHKSFHSCSFMIYEERLNKLGRQLNHHWAMVTSNKQINPVPMVVVNPNKLQSQ